MMTAMVRRSNCSWCLPGSPVHRCYGRRLLAAAALMVRLLAGPVRAQDEGLAFFEKEIRPVLRRECWDCHRTGQASGSLALDSRDGWKTGGDSGPAIVPGEPDKSLLLKAIRHEPGAVQDLQHRQPSAGPHRRLEWKSQQERAIRESSCCFMYKCSSYRETVLIIMLPIPPGQGGNRLFLYGTKVFIS